MENRQILHMLNQRTNFPNIPESFLEIFYLLDDSTDLNIEVLSNKISGFGDFELVLLDILNSGYFNLSRKIDNLNEAVIYLGRKTIQNLLLAALTKSLFPDRKGRSNEFERDKYWDHCIGTAIVSDMLAKKTGLAEMHQLFSYGIVHDIGTLALDFCLPDILSEIYSYAKTEQVSLLRAERHVMNNLTHMEIGAWIANKWRLPKSMVNVILHHHNPTNSGLNEFNIKIIYVADNISTQYYEESLGIKSINTLNENIVHSLGLSMGDIQKIKIKLPNKIRRTRELIDLNMLDVEKFDLAIYSK